jgi:ArpU family phage transcriptional regulator
MMKKLNFQLPPIDREATKKAVEAALEKYQMYLLTESLDNQPNITPNYSIEPPSKTNKFFSTTEKTAIDNVDFEKERKDYIRKIIHAINKLNKIERTVIIKRYLEEDRFDYEIYNELHLSKQTYYKIKARAFYKLALALRIEVYEKGVVNG